MTKTKPAPPEAAPPALPSIPGPYDPDPPAAVSASAQKPPARKRLQFYNPAELAAYEVPDGLRLVGDMHIYRGGIFVVGGAPGIGKSRALTSLAVAGALGISWFDLPVHRRFRTLIIQAENGLVRLSAEYREQDCTALRDWIRVSADADTLAFDDPQFCEELRAVLVEFKPDVVVLDPWNRATRDLMEKDYRDAFDRVLACIGEGDDRPALVICAHTRKPRMGERNHGRGLLALLSGSLVLGSIPRAAFILEAATDDPADDRVVFTVAKNNNGDMPAPTAWQRTASGFTGPLEDFDWDEFHGEGGSKQPTVTLEHLREVFNNGEKWLPLKEAAKALEEAAGVKRTAAYKALEKKGRFAKCLRVHLTDGRLSVRREEKSSPLPTV